MKPLLSGYEKSRWEHSLTCLAFFATPGLSKNDESEVRYSAWIDYSVFGPIWHSNFTNKLFPEKNEVVAQ